MTAQLALPGVPDAPAALAWPGNHVRVAWVGERIAPSPVATPLEAAAYWFANIPAHPFFDPAKEHLAVLLMNAKLRCFAWNLVSVGILNEALAHPREVFRPALVAAAYGIVLMHNHPSGDSAPSEADRRLTSRLLEAGRLLQVQLIDHIIVGVTGPDRHFSFRESGLI